ncbi:MAG: hypothetical protein MHM6MM_001093 [Cercozoa sp. M6MM]
MLLALTSLLALAVSDVAAAGETGVRPGAYDVYVMAQSWQSTFCCARPWEEECKEHSEAKWAAKNLVLHGLWPQYGDELGFERGFMWPQYCGDYADCDTRNSPAKCNAPPKSIEAHMASWQRMAPGYARSDNFLAHHEWMKHGTCSGYGVDADLYFGGGVDAMNKVPTPAVLQRAVGGYISLSDLQNAFGGAHMAGLSCTRSGELDQVFTCFEPQLGLPGKRVPCPRNLLKRGYSNSCVVFNHNKVHVPSPHQCGDDDLCVKSECTSDDECGVGCLRCSNSKKCTDVPLTAEEEQDPAMARWNSLFEGHRFPSLGERRRHKSLFASLVRQH